MDFIDCAIYLSFDNFYSNLFYIRHKSCVMHIVYDLLISLLLIESHERGSANDRNE